MQQKTKFARIAERSSYASSAWLLMVVLLVVAGIRAPYLFSGSGIGSFIVNATPLILVAMAMTVTALVGSNVDLSAGALMIFVNVSLVKFLFDHSIGSPWIVFLFAIGLGVLVQVIQAAIMAIVRIEPIIVTLAAFLALSGLNLVILSRPQGRAPNWLGSWGAGRDFFGPMTLLVIIVVLAWWLFTRTSLYTRIKLVGANERTAFVSGVPVFRTRLLAHVISGVLIGLAGLSYTGFIASGNPTQSATYTLAAVTALVLGGTSLAGGAGGMLGTIPGAIAVSLISFTLSTFPLGLLASFVTQFTYGVILVLALTLGVLARGIIIRKKRSAVA